MDPGNLLLIETLYLRYQRIEHPQRAHYPLLVGLTRQYFILLLEGIVYQSSLGGFRSVIFAKKFVEE